jgi:hypothetical protein
MIYLKLKKIIIASDKLRTILKRAAQEATCLQKEEAGF